jgi:AAA+ ATPase superfamily predicted ATPase
MTVDTDGRMTFGFSAARDPGDIDATIERLLELPAEIAAEKRKRVVVYFDEFQEVTRLDPHLPGLMRSVFQWQRDVAHVYAGSKREMMHRLFNDRNEPFYRSAKTMEIGGIEAPVFAPFVRAQFELAVTRGHPHATQQLAYALWEEVPQGFTASEDDVEAALRAVLRAENARFTLVWDSATSPQKLLLQAFAREPGRPFSNAYRIAHELPSSSGVQRALRPLIAQELVRKEPDGSYDLAEPFLREWVLGFAT